MDLARYKFGEIIQKQLGSQLICYRKKYWRDLSLAIAWQFANSPNLVPHQYLFLYGIWIIFVNETYTHKNLQSFIASYLTC